MEALILLSFVGVLWLTSSRQWRRRFINPFALLLLLYFAVTSPLMVSLATWGLTVSLPVDSGEAADAIVILGRGGMLQNQRVELAEQLWHAGRASKVFISGMTDVHPLLEHLKESGVPGQILSGEGCSQNTEENAQFTAAELYPQNVRKILLVTDTPHMLRSFLMFHSFGFVVTPRASSLPSQWSSRAQVLFIFREYLALGKYMLSGRFMRRTDAELKHPSPEVLEKLFSWNCRVKGI